LFIPSLWFHNVLTITASISVNIFWKHLEEEYYAKKDLYGNKELIIGSTAMSEVDQICEKLQHLPKYYRDFYALKIIENIK